MIRAQAIFMPRTAQVMIADADGVAITMPAAQALDLAHAITDALDIPDLAETLAAQRGDSDAFRHPLATQERFSS